MVELAWVERRGGGFLVRRARYGAVGETFEMRTERGTVVLVLSQLDASRLDDAEVLTTVAASLVRAVPSAGIGSVN